MGKISNISWCDATWNIARGCSKVDADCLFCYMFRESLNETRYKPKEVVRTKTVFNLPLKLKDPSRIFTSSLTDFFHPEIDSYRNEAWDIIRKCPQHTFQILTKRPERIFNHLPEDWGDGWDNVWLGTSVGSQASVDRIDILERVPAKTKFASFEPLHGKITEGFRGALDWVIIGGESGNDSGKYRYRPCSVEWIEYLVEAFSDTHSNMLLGADTKIFVKQLGTYLSKQLGLKDRHGGNMDEWPESLNHLKLREFPS
ncbi:DUF5131 family protein [Dyadobacter sp. 3J3]|uniref:DUF5131 family protein n=1 Tax=Dyadobacter sp. 3J3 TaxID=2606600 RepID=UPI0013585680|nr:DUF5131 family protein [Dyadobacter sp. 3J3]